MRTYRLRTVTYGALVGALLSLMAMALFGGRFALGSATATPVAEGSAVAQIGFEASTGWMYLLAVMAGLVAGGCIAAATYAVGREAQPEAPRFPLRWVVPVAAGVGALFSYGGLRTTLLLGGETTEGVGTISLVAMVVGLLSTGAVAGAITAALVDRLARPEKLGLGGEAWPTSPRALIGEAARAVGTPMMAMVAAGGFAVVLAEVLLALEGTAAVVVFSLAAAVVLGGASLLAYRPWERRTGDTASPSS
ncbi:MAG: hypothetical protein M3349_04850 [Actinomycetota bacterium]|nr:hypothetical protein [Actinomycetota bacterium]